MDSYKKKRLFIGLSSFLIFLIALVMLFIISVNIRNSEGFVTDGEFVRLGLKISFLPPESEPSKAFFRLSEDNRLSKSGYDQVENLLSSYFYEMDIRHKKIDTSEMSELEKAKINLAAFNEIGYLIVPHERIDQTRNELIKNIKKLEDTKSKYNKEN